MKTLCKFFAVLTVLAFSSAAGLLRAQDAPPPPPPDQGGGDQDDQGTSFQTFYDQLGSQGNWVQTDNYGYVFQPNVSDPNWAPYTDGHWVYTDQGWTWVSDEPWGWATYHYGRWANIDGTGWVWVPGYRWAPAWVSWRYGGGYAGWAPLPPETFVGAEYGDPGVRVDVGFHFGGDVDVNFNIGPGCYNFVNVGDLGEGNYRGHYLDRSRNYTVINRTTNITNINITKTTVINNYGATGAATNFRGVAAGGPPINEVNAHSHQRIQTVQLAEANQPGRSTLQGNSLAVYAPRVNAASAREAKPANVSQTLSHPTFNRGDSITKPLAVNASVRPAEPTAEAIEAAKTARLHAPATAKIATEKTKVKTPLTKPLTSMEPVTQVRRTTETAAPSVNAPGGANTFDRKAEPSAVNAPYTGEAVKPAATAPAYHPDTEAKPAATYRPETEAKPAATYHPETEVKPEATYRPETEVKPETNHREESEVKPTQTYHPQSQPTETIHPQSQATHEAAPAAHTAPAPAAKSAGGNEGKKAADDKNKPAGQ